MSVINLASARAARKAATCTFEIFGDLGRPQPSDIVSVGIAGDFGTAADIFQRIAEARCGSRDGECALPLEMTQEPDGRYWVEGYISYAGAVALRDHCRACGLTIQAA